MAAAQVEKRILIVDDSTFSRAILAKLFGIVCPQCTLKEAKNAAVALEILAAGQEFDLVTIDMHMPGMNGLELAQTLRERGVDSALSLVTANVQEAIRGKAEHLGMYFVAKPLSAKKVAALMEAT